MKDLNRCSLSYSRLHGTSSQLALHMAESRLLQRLGLLAELVVLHPGELGLARVDVVPYCLPVLVSKIGLLHPCLGEHRQTAGTGCAACEHTPVAERQNAGNEIQIASSPQLVVQ